MKRYSISALALAVMVAVLSPPLTRDAAASSIEPLDVEALSARADRILVGHVDSVESHFIAPGSRYIVTDVTLTTERSVLGGAPSNHFVVRHLGGAVGKLGQLVYGEASYRVGETVILFASERQGAFFAVGMAQGVMHVYVDSAGIRRASSNGRPLDEVLDRARAAVAGRTGR
ncbi:MAG: hypothetical protein JWM74_2129 [Myxococcaceae bacterium]|nr:hypothetical protein [Myxococcaceae bacterium]